MNIFLKTCVEIMTNISPGDWLEKNVANSFRHMFFQVPFLKIDLEKVSETVKGLVEGNAHTEKKGKNVENNFIFSG